MIHKSLLDMYDLTGKVAIVTGCSRGVGVALSTGLAKAGCDLVITARNIEKLKEVAENIKQYGHKVVPVQMDVSIIKDVKRTVDRAINEFGKIDILVNNAGISVVVEAENMKEKEWQDVIDVNLKGVFLCAQEVGRIMLKQGYGKIINISSMYGFVASSYVTQIAYDASKAGVLGLTKALAVEWAPKGLQVIALAPGFIWTDASAWAFKKGNKLGEQLLKKVPMGRMASLTELEGTILYLASSASNYMNGQALIIDGGFLAW